MKRFLYLWLALLLAFSVAGCGDETAEITLPDWTAEAGGEAAESPVVDIYWDATESMRGYTTIEAGNVYRTLPDSLGDIAGSMGEAHFFRFGEQVTPLEGRSYRDFGGPGVYTEVITSFGTVIDQADENHLSIVVTDLFESAADWSNVTKKLKDKYFAKHLAVAVIGVKSPFNGPIFDVGLSAAKYDWNSGTDPAKFRPFYLFLMGPDSAVRDFMDRWAEHYKGDAGKINMQYAMFSERVGEGKSSFPDLDVVESQNLFNNESLNIKDKHVREFGCDSYGDETSLKVAGSYQPGLGAPRLDMDKLDGRVEVYSLADGEWTQLDLAKESLPKLYFEGGGEGDYQVTMTFTPEETLELEKVNLLRVRVTPKNRSMQVPAWVADWNMAGIDIDPGAFDGARTANLTHVMDSLLDTVLSVAQPALLNMVVVINAK